MTLVEIPRASAPVNQLERTSFDRCPLCGNTHHQPVRSQDCTRHALYDPRLPPKIDWRRCTGCDHVYTSGYFANEAEYVLQSRTQDSQIPGYDIERQREIAAVIVDRVRARFVGSIGSWLDVGCGSGALLMTVAEYGIKAMGLDVRASTVEMLRSLGYDVRRCELETLPDAGSFDVISMMDVVEHHPFPKQLLQAAKEMLAPRGALIVSMPNSDSSVWRMLDRVNQNPYWGELEHYHNFSRESLYRLLALQGFEPVSYGVSRRYRACMEVIARHASD